MSDLAFRPERSAVPPHRAAEQRNTVRSTGTEQRNNTGTVNLKELAVRVLSRAHGGMPSGTEAERDPFCRSAAPGTHPKNAPCPHVTEAWLAQWYAGHPEVVCARCWLERKGRPIREAP